MKIDITTCLGQIPTLSDYLLPDGYASHVRGARLERGDLSPMRSNSSVHSFPSAVSSFALFSGVWLGWAGDVDAVPGPVDTNRLYITGDGAPRMRIGTTGIEFPLALSPPTTPPVTTLFGTLDTSNTETIHYAFTWVTSLGEETPPSPLSIGLDWSPGLIVRVNSFDATPPNRLFTKKRIYRSQTSASGTTALYFVAEVSEALTTYDHDLAAEPFVELISSTDYDAPPIGMTGIIALPNGVMAAFDGQEILYSEPYLPHAWPKKYRMKTDYPVVGLVAFGSTLAILTTGTPYIAQGTHPDSMIMEKIEQNYPCVSKRGIVDLGYAAAYPSTDGLITISQGSGAQLATKNLFTREQWAALEPSTFRASQIDGRYIFSYGSPGTLGFISLTGEVPFYLEEDQGPIALQFHVETGKTFLLEANGKDVVSFDDFAEPVKPYSWVSREFRYPHEVSFGAIVVEGEILTSPGGFVCLVRVFADGIEITNTNAFNAVDRIPAGRHKNWKIQVESNARVTRVCLAGSPAEIAGGL